jgi:hypothetical protein
MEALSIPESQVDALQVVGELLPWRDQLRAGFGTAHGNARLELIDVLTVMLAAFFNPMARSQRLLEALSGQDWMREKHGVSRVPRSTLSDALKRFDPEALRPLVDQLVARVPALARRDADLAEVTRRIVAADGTYINLAGEVAWSLLSRRGRGPRVQSRVRLDFQVDVETFTPLDVAVAGGDAGSEPLAFLKRLRPGVVYVADRGFFSFALLRGLLEAGSNFVVRMKKDVGFEVRESRPLSPRDVELGVRSDDTGVLPGPKSPGNADLRSYACRPPGAVLRRVVVWDERNRTEVILLTDLLDVPALVVAELYRRRWAIELFFKWLKCCAGFDHAISHSPRGLTFQFYVAVIGTLLLHLATGRRVSKYAVFWLQAVASGQATWDEMQAGLARIEREKALEKARLARRRAAKKLA